MHKKLEAELVGLAHSILQMKNNNDIVSLHKTAQELYEKLSILKFVNANLEITSMENDESKQKVSNVTENTEVELVEEKNNFLNQYVLHANKSNLRSVKKNPILISKTGFKNTLKKYKMNMSFIINEYHASIYAM